MTTEPLRLPRPDGAGGGPGQRSCTSGSNVALSNQGPATIIVLAAAGRQSTTGQGTTARRRRDLTPPRTLWEGHRRQRCPVRLPLVMLPRPSGNRPIMPAAAGYARRAAYLLNASVRTCRTRRSGQSAPLNTDSARLIAAYFARSRRRGRRARSAWCTVTGMPANLPRLPRARAGARRCRARRP